MKIFSAEQIRSWDTFTIQNEPIPSIDLMERASRAFANHFESLVPNDHPLYVVCGPGNNGGDGLAIARILDRRGYDVHVWTCAFANTFSEDYSINLERAKKAGLAIKDLDSDPQIEVPGNGVVIDALFGTGLSRELEGPYAQLVANLNALPSPIISVDIPSGLFCDEMTVGAVIMARQTLTFQAPKLSFFLNEHESFVNQWIVCDIGLSGDFYNMTGSTYHYLSREDILLTPRSKFSHKGTFGHALLACGSFGKAGAAVLASRACLRSGAGLLTVHTPSSNREILQSAVPEAMLVIDKDNNHISSTINVNNYTSTGIGPGLGMEKATQRVVKELLENAGSPLVIDADALNIIAEAGWLDLIPPYSVLTPHPKEFERLFGVAENHLAEIRLQQKASRDYQLVIVLKGASTSISDPEGNCYFNTSGNPGMATAGSGDALTGIITALLAQGYPPVRATQTGVFVHGLAGDLAAARHGEEALIAGDIIDSLPEAFKSLSYEN